jgi:hypothetical protein
MTSSHEGVGEWHHSMRARGGQPTDREMAMNHGYRGRFEGRAAWEAIVPLLPRQRLHMGMPYWHICS